MAYTVIYPSGKVMTFYVRAVAELYATLNRGTLVSNEVFSLETPENTPTTCKVIQK